MGLHSHYLIGNEREREMFMKERDKSLAERDMCLGTPFELSHT